jgi:hypothetical protein
VPDAAAIGRRILETLELGRARLNAARRRDADEVFAEVTRLYEIDVSLRLPGRGRTKRIAKQLRGLRSTRTVYRMVRTLNAMRVQRGTTVVLDSRQQQQQQRAT